MTTMKAVLFRTFGTPNVLEIKLDYPKPIRKPGEVLVQIKAASVNPIDFKTRKGEVPRFLVKLPKVLGADLSGTVVEVDEGSKFKVGDSVYGCIDYFSTKEGCYSEYFCAKEQHLAKAPTNLNLEDAAALPLVSLTAWQALEALKLKPGQRILIHAGAGGVGSVAIQLAKARFQLHVTTTCSTRNVNFCKSLGADEVVDYTKVKFEETCGPFDGVIDLIGGSIEIRSMKVLKKTGAMASVINSGWATEKGVALGSLYVMYYLAKYKVMHAVRCGPRYHVILMSSNGEQLTEITKLVESGQIKPIIDQKMALESAALAHEISEKGHNRGKIVLTIN